MPQRVVAQEEFCPPEHPEPDVLLFPEEAAVVARAATSRRQEYSAARRCARRALGRLGLAPAPIVPGEMGAPMWPAGIVGSITHCAGYRAAALARRDDIVTIGIDAEPHEKLPDGVLDLVTTGPERVMLAELATTAPGTSWDRLLFSAKESVYKAWFPVTGRWLDFIEAQVTIDPAAMLFTAQLLVPGPPMAGRWPRRFEGRYVIRNGLVLTAIAVAA